MNTPEKSLAQRIRKTRAFFAPKNLESLILKYDGQAILLVIDVQREFCDPWYSRGNKETKAVSERIQSIAPAFRRAGVPVYAVYYSTTGEKERRDIDFYKFLPASEDQLFAKSTDSAFESGRLKKALENDKRKLLLVCGFNQAACVKRTVLSARKEGYDVCLLEDLAGNDNWNTGGSGAKAAMEKKGVIMAASADVLKLLRAPAPKP
ncbi:MAG: isochorismatase family protein [Alphaproteobacteria bacterium]|nr:isochorismatase family protein [Alphaproteobacteria bacterium]